MTKEIIYRFESAYRGDFNVRAYHFNKGEKSCCIVGSMRGNEIQQLYVCSKLIKALSRLEKQCRISYGHRITVIPCVNPFSVNTGKRFWSSDSRDINRDFPGISGGEPTQRIADSLMKTVSGYRYGIQFASFYIGGDFIPHVRMMETGMENASLANLFGMPYVLKRDPIVRYKRLFLLYRRNGGDRRKKRRACGIVRTSIPVAYGNNKAPLSRRLYVHDS